jgi:hypothetical protein
LAPTLGPTTSPKLKRQSCARCLALSAPCIARSTPGDGGSKCGMVGPDGFCPADTCNCNLDLLCTPVATSGQSLSQHGTTSAQKAATTTRQRNGAAVGSCTCSGATNSHGFGAVCMPSAGSVDPLAWCYVSQDCPTAARSKSVSQTTGKPLYWTHCKAKAGGGGATAAAASAPAWTTYTSQLSHGKNTKTPEGWNNHGLPTLQPTHPPTLPARSERNAQEQQAEIAQIRKTIALMAAKKAKKRADRKHYGGLIGTKCIRCLAGGIHKPCAAFDAGKMDFVCKAATAPPGRDNMPTCPPATCNCRYSTVCSSILYTAHSRLCNCRSQSVARIAYADHFNPTGTDLGCEQV